MAKILVVGPSSSGKTCIANLVSDNSILLQNSADKRKNVLSLENLPYDPTAAVRVLEFEQNLKGRGDQRNWDGAESVSVELWDCSGDLQYESCWPAIMADANGVIIVFNPENAGQRGQIKNWYEWFVKDQGLKPEQCLIFANGRGDQRDQSKSKLFSDPDLQDLEVVYTSHDDCDREFVGTLGKYVSIGEEAKS